MYTEKTKNDCVKFLNQHLETQVINMMISQKVNASGYPGFAWMFQIQSTDEAAHQRRIENYLQNTPGWEEYDIAPIKVANFTIKDPVEAVEKWLEVRTNMLIAAEEYRENAKTEKDQMSEKFYDWFIQDGWSEIEEFKDLHDRLKMPNSDWARFDLKANETAEVDLDRVIIPMRSFIPDEVK